MIASIMVFPHRHRAAAIRRRGITLFLLFSAGLFSSCAPRLRSLSFLYDPHFFAISSDTFPALKDAAREAGFLLVPVAIPDSSLSSGFFAAVDGTTDKVIAVSPLFSREVVSAVAKYPDRTFVFVDEVASLEPGPRLRLPRFSLSPAMREAGGLCARILASSPSGSRPLALLVPADTETSSDSPDETAFLAGFRASYPDGSVVRYPIAVPSDPESGLPFPTGADGSGRGGSSAAGNERPALAVVLLGAWSPLWAEKFAERGIPYICEGGIRRASFDKLIIASVETDPVAGFRAELDALRNGSSAPRPMQAELRMTGAASKYSSLAVK
jgi:hypothetical protein